jgi:UDP-glucose 4-epimerase
VNILVTGGAGFIGSHIVNTYIEAGHCVTVIDNLSSGRLQFLNPKAKFYEIDILDPKITEVIKSEKINAINHHAAQISVSGSIINPLFDANSNIIGTLQLLQCAVSLGVKKFIFASTGGAIYGEQIYFPANEDHPCQPLTPYGISKLSTENYLKFFNEQFGMSTTILRYSKFLVRTKTRTGKQESSRYSAKGWWKIKNRLFLAMENKPATSFQFGILHKQI